MNQVNKSPAQDEMHIGGIVIEKVIPFLKTKWLAFVLSGSIIVGGAIGFVKNGGFDLGIDFKGGLKIETKISQPNITINEIRKIFSDAKTEADVNTVGNASDQQFLITVAVTEGTTAAETTKVNNLLFNSFGKAKVEIKSSELVEPKMGKSFAGRALYLLVIVSALIVLYIIIRFDFYYSVGALVATLHDLFIMLAFSVFFRIPIDITIIAALLTIMGYSINDTIVVYDRIRELVGLNKDEDLEYVMNKSITQTLSRTIITVLTVVFVATAIYVWGGSVLKNFALLLIVGLISGTYSSIFMSAPVVYITKKAFDKNFKEKKKVATA
jgi:preprotein translocase SecF subunit